MGQQAKKKWAQRMAIIAPPPWTPFARAHFRPEDLAALGVGSIAPDVQKNSRYTVVLRDVPARPGRPAIVHLSIKRNDRLPIHDWRDLQRIKNELCGVDREGYELYPAESRLVDEANQYHIFVFPPGYTIGFGFADRLVSETTVGKSVQRPFDPTGICGPVATASALGMREI